MAVEIRQLKDRGTGEEFVPVTAWEAIGNRPDDYAKEASVKDGNDTTIGMLKDQTNGLAAIKSAIPVECSNDDIDRMFETTTEDGLIIVPSGLITPDGTMPIGVFTAITGLTPTE